MTGSGDPKSICMIDNSGVAPGDPDVIAAAGYVADQHGRLDNMYKAMMHSPRVIKPVHDLYIALLHDDDSPLEQWQGELLAVQVAVINRCAYALAHHSANLELHINNTATYRRYMSALENNSWTEVLDDQKIIAMLDYGEKLCRHPEKINRDDLENLRERGFSEKEIVFIAQINSGFAYWTRILNALGVALAGEPVGIAAKSGS